jgi:hypothetical protein
VAVELGTTDTDQANPWFSIFAKLHATLGGLKESVDRANSHALRQFQREIIFKIQTVSQALASPSVFASGLWTPPEGYWWDLHQVAVSGPVAANGTMLALAGVNVDLYVTGGFSTGMVPSVGDWRGSSGTSATNPGVPTLLAFSAKECTIQNGESVAVVCSGAGVTTSSMIYVTLFVSQFAGFANLIADQPTVG